MPVNLGVYPTGGILAVAPSIGGFIQFSVYFRDLRFISLLISLYLNYTKIRLRCQEFFKYFKKLSKFIFSASLALFLSSLAATPEKIIKLVSCILSIYPYKDFF